jgi:hypothetical protein
LHFDGIVFGDVFAAPVEELVAVDAGGEAEDVVGDGAMPECGGFFVIKEEGGAEVATEIDGGGESGGSAADDDAVEVDGGVLGRGQEDIGRMPMPRA